MTQPPSDSAICRLEVFRDVPEDAVRELVARARILPVTAGQILYRQGEASKREALLLLAGRLSVHVDAGGKRRPLADIWPGEVVGEIGLYTRTPERTATVVSSAPGHVLQITMAMLAEPDQPAVAALEVHLIQTLARRIAGAHKLLHRVVGENQPRGKE